MTTTDKSAELVVDTVLELEQEGMSRSNILTFLQAYCRLLPKFDSGIAFEDLDSTLTFCNPLAFARFVKLTAELTSVLGRAIDESQRVVRLIPLE